MLNLALRLGLGFKKIIREWILNDDTTARQGVMYVWRDSETWDDNNLWKD